MGRLTHFVISPAPKVVPNPAGDQINISSLQREIKSVEVIDKLGRLNLQKQLANNTTLDITELQSGVYYIRITLKNIDIAV